MWVSIFLSPQPFCSDFSSSSEFVWTNQWQNPWRCNWNTQQRHPMKRTWKPLPSSGKPQRRTQLFAWVSMHKLSPKLSIAPHVWNCPTGATCGTKQTATAQALLMSFTSTPMPKLIGDGDDWSHLFPKASVLAGRTPELCYKKFHEDLKAMSLRCEQYNAEAHTRPFPECFPMYTNNPGVLECSISVWEYVRPCETSVL